MASGTLKVKKHTKNLYRFLSDDMQCVVERDSNCLGP